MNNDEGIYIFTVVETHTLVANTQKTLRVFICSGLLAKFLTVKMGF